MIGASFGNVELLEGAKELFQETGIKRIQDFYGITFEELFDTSAMRKKGIKEEDLKYVLDNRDRESAIKSKEAWEMRRGLFTSDRWLKLCAFYGISERDIRNIENLKKAGLKAEDIAFITGKEEEPVGITTVIEDIDGNEIGTRTLDANGDLEKEEIKDGYEKVEIDGVFKYKKVEINEKFEALKIKAKEQGVDFRSDIKYKTLLKKVSKK